ACANASWTTSPASSQSPTTVTTARRMRGKLARYTTSSAEGSTALRVAERPIPFSGCRTTTLRMVTDQRRVLARGRASDVIDLGDGRVLRRFRLPGGAPAREAAVMRHVRAHGYPVPAVLDVHADALVLELVDGPTMDDAAERDPATVAGHARTLAALHDQ